MFTISKAGGHSPEMDCFHRTLPLEDRENDVNQSGHLEFEIIKWKIRGDAKNLILK